MDGTRPLFTILFALVLLTAVSLPSVIAGCRPSPATSNPLSECMQVRAFGNILPQQTPKPTVIPEGLRTILQQASDPTHGPVFGPFGSRLRTTPMPKVERDRLFSKPAVMGDSLSHGFYGALIRPDTQQWAFPVLVQTQARLGNGTAVPPALDQLNFNLIQGLYFDLPAGLPFDVHGEAHQHEYTYPGRRCDPICIAHNLAGDLSRSLGTRLPKSVTPINHLGITGADFYDALYANEACADLRAPVNVTEMVGGQRTINVKSFSIKVCNPVNSSQCVTLSIPGVSLSVPTISTKVVSRSVRKDGTVATAGFVTFAPKEVPLPVPCIPLLWGGCYQPTYLVLDYPVWNFDPTPKCNKSSGYARWAYQGLRDLSNNTQMDQVEAVKPTFLMVVLGNNHVLSCLTSRTGELDLEKSGCLDFEHPRPGGPTERFLKSIGTFRTRVLRLQSQSNCGLTSRSCGHLMGGLIALVPDVSAIPLLKPYQGPGCEQGGCLVQMLRPDCRDDSCFLNPTELQRLRQWREQVNNHIRQLAAELKFAVFDMDRYFQEAIRQGGWAVSGMDPQTRDQRRIAAPPRAAMSWPLANAPGVFSLDGVHPNMLGHAMIANAIINELNHQYYLTGDARIPNLDETEVLARDPLNVHPVDIGAYINAAHAVTTDIAQALSNVFRGPAGEAEARPCLALSAGCGIIEAAGHLLLLP